LTPPVRETKLATPVRLREGGGPAEKEVTRMPTYVTLVRWTDQGIRNVKDAPKRVEAFETAVKGAGGKLKDFYLVMGEYDLVVVTEAPNDETVARLTLATGMMGNVRTTTMRAFTREETTKIIGSLP
jgi:uncharacterized protein with GYD domain